MIKKFIHSVMLTVISISFLFSQTTVDFNNLGFPRNHIFAPDYDFGGLTFRTSNNLGVGYETESGYQSSESVYPDYSVGTVATLTIRRSNDNQFNLTSLYLDDEMGFGSSSYRIAAWENGSEVDYEIVDVSIAGIKTVNLATADYVLISAIGAPNDVAALIDHVTYEDAASATAPEVTTSAASSVSSTSASLGGNVTSDGGASVTGRGVVYSSSDNTPTIGEGGVTQDANGSGTGSFSETISGLSPGTTYYFQAYATNSEGTTYGGVENFTTDAVTPTVTTTAISDITTTSAAGGGNVTSDGGASVTARGICWNTTGTPTLSDDYTSDGTGTGSFSSSLSGLTPGTTYYVRAYATNSAGTAFGGEENFSTDNATVTFTDGSGYSVTPVPPQTDQPFGRFALAADVAGSNFTEATIILNGIRSGATNFKLWHSSDASFESGADTQLGSTVALDPGDGGSVNFSGFSNTITTTGGYYFVTCDIAENPEGLIQGVIQNNAALSFAGATLSGTIENALLSGDDVALPVQLSSFTALAGDAQVTLTWITETETNNEAFLLQRSNDGETFEPLAEIDGRGNASERSEYSYTDRSVFNGRSYYYRLGDRDINGVITWHNTVEAFPNAAGLSKNSTALITDYALLPAYPNPFNPETNIRFAVPNTDNTLKNVKLNVFNLLGQKVASLYNGPLAGGAFTMKWNGRNDQGITQPSGVYLIHFQSEQFVQTQKIVLVR